MSAPWPGMTLPVCAARKVIFSLSSKDLVPVCRSEPVRQLGCRVSGSRDTQQICMALGLLACRQPVATRVPPGGLNSGDCVLVVHV